MQAPSQETSSENITLSSDEIANKLCEFLETGIDIHRCAAAQALGKIANPIYVKPLIAGLMDEDEDVRADVAHALEQIGDNSSADALLENLLGDPSNDVKTAAIDALVAMKADNVVPWLRRLVAARDEEINWDDSEFYESGWDDWLDIQLKSLVALGDLGDFESIPAILRAMEDVDAQDMQAHAFKAFSKMGETGIVALSVFMDNPRPLTRIRAATSLCQSNEPTAADHATKCLKNEEEDIRKAAAFILAEKDANDPRLTEMLWDKSQEIRTEMLKKIGIKHVQWTIAQLDEKTQTSQIAALNVISKNPDYFNNNDLLLKLNNMLDGANYNLQTALIPALSALGDDKAIQLLGAKLNQRTAPTDLRLAMINAMDEIGIDAVDNLSAILGDDERQIRLTAMAALVRIAKAQTSWPNPAGDVLLAALSVELVKERTPDEIEHETRAGDDTIADETEMQVRETMQPVPPFNPNEPVEPSPNMEAMAEAEREVTKAAEAENQPEINAEIDSKPVGDIERPSIIDKVDQALLDSEETHPTSTLGMILADEKAAQKLTVQSHEMLPLDQNEKELLALSQKTLKKQKVSIDTVVAPHLDVKFFSAKLVGDLAQPDVANALAQHVRSGDKELRMAVIESLSMIGKHLSEFDFEVIQPLLMSLNDPDRDIRMLSIRALASAPDKGTLNLIAEKSVDEDNFVRIEAAKVLGNMAQDSKPLLPFLQDEDVNVRLVAAEALSLIGGDQATELLCEFAIRDGVKYAIEAGRMLQRLDVPKANAILSTILEDEDEKMKWLPVITTLGMLNAREGHLSLIV